MRSIKLTAATAAAALLLTLAAAGASAHRLSHRHVSTGGKCSVNLFVEPHQITSGESVELFGRLQCADTSDEGQAVTINGRSVTPALAHILASSGPVVATTTTTTGGFFSVVQPNVTMDSAFSASALGATSPTRTVKVAPVVTLGGPSEVQPLFTGRHDHVTFTGTVNSADAGAKLVLQRENSAVSEEWHPIGFGVVGPGGVYSITHTFRVPGDANLRVVVRRHRQFSVRGISNTLSYGISQRQTPGLSIHTTAYSVGYGTPVTISGVLSSGAGKTVTLQARTRTAHKELTTVAIATTEAGGAYKFVLTPLQNTRYHVSGDGLSSAILFQGVKYVLTPGVPATTVQAGQPLTFSGTVVPGNAGKPVYLERENSSGGGFHVADVGSVGAGGAYSITDFLFGSGKAVFRIKVSGDPANQQAVSAPFQIEVTPAAPPALKPVKQPKVPTEGIV
jgi:hypothetical protein